LKKETAKTEFAKTEKYLKNLECIAQLVGEVIQKLTEEKIMVKAASGPRYVVGCRPKIDKSKLKPGVRVTLDMTTYTIMQISQEKLIQQFTTWWLKTQVRSSMVM